MPFGLVGVSPSSFSPAMRYGAELTDTPENAIALERIGARFKWLGLQPMERIAKLVHQLSCDLAQSSGRPSLTRRTMEPQHGRSALECR